MGRVLWVMLAASREFRVDGKIPTEESEPWLHLGAQDRPVWPLVPPASAHRGPGLVPSALFPKCSVCSSCCVAHQTPFPPQTCRGCRVKRELEPEPSNFPARSCAGWARSCQRAEAFLQPTLVSHSVSAEHTRLQGEELRVTLRCPVHFLVSLGV